MEEAVEIGDLRIPAIMGRAGRIVGIDIIELEVNAKPTIENIGTESEAILRIGIPKGDAFKSGNVEEDGNLKFILDSGKELNCGNVIGPKGEPFKYEDFTPEQLEALKGPKGDPGATGEKGPKGDSGEKGDPGPKGAPFKYEDFTSEQLEALRGPAGKDGKDGKNGEKGDTFRFEDLTEDQFKILQQKIDMKSTKTITTLEEIFENTDYTIPLKYIVGDNSLEIYYMGEKLIKEIHYIEIGENGLESNIIQFKDWNVPVDRKIEFLVRGVEQSE